jgi:hypothetical protein
MLRGDANADLMKYHLLVWLARVCEGVCHVPGRYDGGHPGHDGLYGVACTRT